MDAAAFGEAFVSSANVNEPQFVCIVIAHFFDRSSAPLGFFALRAFGCGCATCLQPADCVVVWAGGAAACVSVLELLPLLLPPHPAKASAARASVVAAIVLGIARRVVSRRF